MSPETTAIIDDIAEAFAQQFQKVDEVHDPGHKESYTAQCRDDVIAMAIVIHKHYPSYDMDAFYTAAGYLGTHPRHC